MWFLPAGRARAKGAIIAALCYALALLSCIADQQVVSTDRSIPTPIGRFGFWKVTMTDSGSTNQEFWLLFGKIGRLHVRRASTSPIPLLPLTLLIGMAGAAVALSARRRATAQAARQLG